ncbi:hypothetical protein CBS14141_000868 [Malassezia furfur]|nr:hypothetical protein CBS14141_000868 [Malassezia furfur]
MYQTTSTAAEPIVMSETVYTDAASEPKLATVSHVALDAIAAAIWGSPFYDTEFVVKHKGKDQSLYLHSAVAKRMQSGNTIELDAMEFDPPASKRAAGGAVRPGAGAGARGAGAMRPADDEVLLSDDDSTDSFDDASVNDTASIASSVATATGPVAAAPARAQAHQPPATPPTMSSRNQSTTSLTSPLNSVSHRSASIFTKFMKRGNQTRDELGGAADVPRDESGRLRRYSALHEEAGPGASSNGVKQFRVTGATPRSVQALLFYLYTSQVHFVSSPHQSPHSDATSLHEEASELLGDGSKQNPSLWPPAFSSKAAYCLGQQLDLPDLTLRAFDHLTLNLSSRTVLADLLSPFGDRFPEVQRAHLDFITLHWEEVKTRPDFGPTIENLVHGQYPNSSKSLFQLFSKLSIRSF